MKNHWDKNLKVKELVQKYKPQLVVELGAGGGDNSKQYLELQKTQSFKFIIISDGIMPEDMKGLGNFTWIFGISYLELPKFEDKSIDFCSIDTDHNYWTLKHELAVLTRKMKSGGIVVMHDTESYKNTSGIMTGGYQFKFSYPPEICELQHIGMGKALDEALASGSFRMIKQTKESAGATAIQKT